MISLLWSLKCHKLYLKIKDDEILRKDVLKKLTRKSAVYHKQYWEKMALENIELPQECEQGGNLVLKYLKKEEKLNEISIALYTLENVRGNNVTISCIMTPGKKILEKYKDKPVCHLLMITDNHVAYIPDMREYMRLIFGDSRDKKRCYRCPTCFYLFRDENKLKNHFEEGVCINNYLNQPD